MPTPPKTRAGTVPIKFRSDRQRWEVTIHHNGKRSRKLYDTEAAANKAWSRHTNVAQLYRSYVAKLVSREEAGRFVGILPKTP